MKRNSLVINSFVWFPFLQIIEDRSKLPIASFKDVITSTVESHQVNLKIFFVNLPLDMHLLVAWVLIALKLSFMIHIDMLNISNNIVELDFSFFTAFLHIF